MELEFRIETKEFRDQLKELEISLPKKAERVAELVATEIVNYAKSTTGETKPGVNEGDGSRQTHPGGWADVTSNLANSIQKRIETNGLEVRAIIEATMEYAAALDAKTGYSVLGGAETKAKKAIHKYQHLIFE